METYFTIYGGSQVWRTVRLN